MSVYRNGILYFHLFRETGKQDMQLKYLKRLDELSPLNAQRKVELERQTTETEVARREAERTVIKAQAEAQAQRMAGLTEAEIMRAKGYTQKDVLQSEVQKAYAAGLGEMGSNGGGSGLGDIAGLGVALGAMGGVVNMTKDALNPVFSGITPPAPDAAAPVGGWSCACGRTNITSNFCPDCGAKKPVPQNGWTCPSCGAANITSNFCPDCGAKKPAPDAGWDCACGQTNIKSNFCPNCGSKKPEPKPAGDSWQCACGTTATGKFCPECGKPKPAGTPKYKCDKCGWEPEDRPPPPPRYGPGRPPRWANPPARKKNKKIKTAPKEC